MTTTAQRFRLDPATRAGLEALHNEMISAYKRHTIEVLHPVRERYRRAVAARRDRERAAERRHDASPPAPERADTLSVEAAVASYYERQRWPFVVAYHRRAYQEFGLAGLLWFMQGMGRGVDHPTLSAAVLLMMTRADDPTPAEIVRWIRQLHGEGLPVTPTMRRPGRRALGSRAMTPAERQRRHRERIRGT